MKKYWDWNQLKENKQFLAKFIGVVLIGVPCGMLAAQLLINLFANPKSIENIQELNKRVMMLGFLGIALWLSVMVFMVYSVRSSRGWINKVGIGSFIYIFLLSLSLFLITNWIIPALLG